MSPSIVAKNPKVVDLPDGYFKERLTEIAIDPEVADIWVVAKPGMIGDWAAYIRFPSIDHTRPDQVLEYEYYLESVRDPDDVLHHGDKLSEGEARQLFPEFTGSYRR